MILARRADPLPKGIALLHELDLFRLRNHDHTGGDEEAENVLKYGK
jgi:hypothetical protein